MKLNKNRKPMTKRPVKAETEIATEAADLLFEVEDVAKVLTDNYEVEAATATADAAAWMEKLVEAGLAE